MGADFYQVELYQNYLKKTYPIKTCVYLESNNLSFTYSCYSSGLFKLRITKNMKNKLISIGSIVILTSTSIYAQTSNKELLKRIEVLEKNQVETSKLTIGGDYRFSVDSLKYKMTNNATVDNSSLFTNRVWLTVGYKQDEHLSFNAKLAYNKAYGQVNLANQAQFDNYDWFSSMTNTDNQLLLKEAYIDYKDTKFFGYDIAWDFGIGRRPTSYNKLISLRDDEAASSPLGHIVSAEFDGGHVGVDLAKQTGISGLRVKLSAGRGLSSIQPTVFATPNANSGKNINMFALNLVTYAEKNLHTELQVLRATNLVDITSAGYDQTGTFNPANYDGTLNAVGDINLASYMAMYTLKDFNNAKVFVSFALSQTDPSGGETMLGSSHSEVGSSIWLGTQFKSLLTKNGKWGVEFNHGSKYFRSFTYAEDTVVGSKMATRGNAYEAYFTEPIYKGLSAQLRLTYIDYNYSGSNGFFGSQTGTPMNIDSIKSSPVVNSDLAANIVDKAQDIRLYLRYKF